MSPLSRFACFEGLLSPVGLSPSCPVSPVQYEDDPSVNPSTCQSHVSYLVLDDYQAPLSCPAAD